MFSAERGAYDSTKLVVFNGSSYNLIVGWFVEKSLGKLNLLPAAKKPKMCNRWLASADFKQWSTVL